MIRTNTNHAGQPQISAAAMLPQQSSEALRTQDTRPFLVVHGDRAAVRGTEGDDKLQICFEGRQGALYRVKVSDGERTEHHLLTREQIKNLRVLGGSGDDVVTLQGSLPPELRGQVQVYGCNGNDQVVASAQVGATFLGGDGHDASAGAVQFEDFAPRQQSGVSLRQTPASVGTPARHPNHTVQPGDSMYGVLFDRYPQLRKAKARGGYGVQQARWVTGLVLKLNPQLRGNPNLLRAGATLRLPTNAEMDAALAAGRGSGALSVDAVTFGPYAGPFVKATSTTTDPRAQFTE